MILWFIFFEQGSRIDEYLTSGAKNASEIIFTLSAETEAEVNEWAEKVKNAGGNILQKVGRDESNYYGFVFADPDGHKFNVLLMEKGMWLSKLIISWYGRAFLNQIPLFKVSLPYLPTHLFKIDLFWLYLNLKLSEILFAFIPIFLL